MSRKPVTRNTITHCLTAADLLPLLDLLDVLDLHSSQRLALLS